MKKTPQRKEEGQRMRWLTQMQSILMMEVELGMYMSLEKRGRKRNMRIPYLPTHPKHKQTQHVVRTTGHNNLPNFIGRYFPQRDDPDSRSLYCASMLLLLKPWRVVKTDL